MAEAYLCHVEGPSGFVKPVVVKVLLSQFIGDKDRVALFLREARVGARLNHANIVSIFDLGAVEGEEHIAMEYVDGLSLLQATKRMWAMGAGLPMDIALRVIAGAAVGLHYAHTLKAPDGSFWGIIHRDVSPDNLMIARDGTVKILDFGVAKLRGSEATQSGEIKGKIPFMSPEQLNGEVELDARSDLWALGVTLYWCLCGRRPFSAKSDIHVMRAILEEEPVRPSAINKAIPPDLDELVMNLLTKDRDKRIPNAAKLAARLHKLLPPTQGNPLAKFIEKLALYDDDPPENRIKTGTIKGIPASPVAADSTDLVMRDMTHLATMVHSVGAELPLAPTTDPGPNAFNADVTVVEGDDDVATTGGSDMHVPATLLLKRERERDVAPSRLPKPALIAAASAAAIVVIAVMVKLAVGGAAPLAVLDAGVRVVVVDEPRAAIVVDAGDVDVVEVPADLPADVDVPVDVDEANAMATRPSRKTRAVVVVAPVRIKWTTALGKPLGVGAMTLQVPENDKWILALDTKRDGKITVPVAAKIEWSKLAEGKLLIRALPYATDVKIGSESLGPTPLAPKLVATGAGATYRVVIVKDSEKQTKIVKVKPNEEVVVAVDFRK